MEKIHISHRQLIGLLDRPIAFHRCFVTVTGSVTAALMLSQALYWQQRTKDESGWWYKTRDEWTAETGMKRKEQEGARRKLRKLGLLHEQRRGVPAQLWYQLDEIRLLELLAKPAETVASPPSSDGPKQPVQLVQKGPTGRHKRGQLDGTKSTSKKAPFGPTFKEQRLHRDYTETTTTTPNPSSFTERAAEPEAVERGGGVRDENRDRDGGQEPAIAETTEHNPVSGEEATDERRPELAYPAKLTDREREDIAAQVGPLPAEVAQQMLDVIASKMQSAQIKTNPAAMLRGIVRKYRADPESFDPSAGFGNAEARRRRAEAEARQRAEAERREREREREAMRTLAPEAMDARRQAVESMRRALRGAAIS